MRRAVCMSFLTVGIAVQSYGVSNCVLHSSTQLGVATGTATCLQVLFLLPENGFMCLAGFVAEVVHPQAYVVLPHQMALSHAGRVVGKIRVAVITVAGHVWRGTVGLASWRASLGQATSWSLTL